MPPPPPQAPYPPSMAPPPTHSPTHTNPTHSSRLRAHAQHAKLRVHVAHCTTSPSSSKKARRPQQQLQLPRSPGIGVGADLGSKQRSSTVWAAKGAHRSSSANAVHEPAAGVGVRAHVRQLQASSSNSSGERGARSWRRSSTMSSSRRTSEGASTAATTPHDSAQHAVRAARLSGGGVGVSAHKHCHVRVKSPHMIKGVRRHTRSLRAGPHLRVSSPGCAGLSSGGAVGGMSPSSSVRMQGHTHKSEPDCKPASLHAGVQGSKVGSRSSQCGSSSTSSTSSQSSRSDCMDVEGVRVQHSAGESHADGQPPEPPATPVPPHPAPPPATTHSPGTHPPGRALGEARERGERPGGPHDVLRVDREWRRQERRRQQQEQEDTHEGTLGWGGRRVRDPQPASHRRGPMAVGSPGQHNRVRPSAVSGEGFWVGMFARS